MNAIAPPAPAVRGARGGGRERERPGPSPSLFDTLGGEPTLEELISGVWEGLAADRPAPCPVCGAEIKPIYEGHAPPAPDDSGTARMSSRTTRARPDQARQDAERAAGSSGRGAGRLPEGGRCGECGTTLR